MTAYPPPSKGSVRRSSKRGGRCARGISQNIFFVFGMANIEFLDQWLCVTSIAVRNDLENEAPEAELKSLRIKAELYKFGS